MKKKLLSLLLVFLMILGMIPMSALAADAPFTVTVGGEAMTEFTVGEVTDPYNGIVPLYTVTIPDGTAEVNITWNDGNSYTLSYYDANANYFGFESGMQNSWTVAMDKNGDGAYDMLQVYDSSWGVPYWITFASAAEEEPEQPVNPFTVTVGGEAMTEFTVGEVTDPYNGTVPLYTVTIPAGTAEVNITWNDGNSYTLSYYDANANYFGFESGMQNSWTVAMDKNGDGAYDMLQVYDSSWGVPYWITFTSVAEEEPEQPAVPTTVTVYMTAMYQGEFVTAKESGTVMALEKITVPYFDLANYGLECLYYNPYCYVDADGNRQVTQTAGTKETAEGVVTMLHLFIYATEVYWLGIDAEDAGEGYLAEVNWSGFEVYDKTPGSAFINFWDYASNLNYYLNYEYPLAYPGWGATLDQMALKDGDVVSVRHNRDLGTEELDGRYHHFGSKGDVSKTTTQANDVVLTLYKCTHSLDYSTGHERQGEGHTVYVSPNPWIEDDAVSYTTNKNGQVTIETSTLEPGTYYVISNNFDPAVMMLTVEGVTHSHRYDAVVTAPTCTEEGYTTYTCSCGDSYDSDFVDATGHNYENGVCTGCGDIKTIIPEGARFLNITTDVEGEVIIEEQAPYTGYYSDRDLPYYHIVLPEGAKYAYIKYNQSDILISQWSYAAAYKANDASNIGSGGSPVEPQAVKYDDGTADVSIIVSDMITQIPRQGAAMVMYNSSYEFGEIFTFGYQIPAGYYDVSIPISERYTVTGETIAKDGYTFNVTINEGWYASEDFAVKVNGEALTANADGSYTVESVTERLIITVEGVKFAPRDPDLFISVDMTNITEDRYVDVHMSTEGIDMPWTYVGDVCAAGEKAELSYSTEQLDHACIIPCVGMADGKVLGYKVGDVECIFPGEYKQFNIADGVYGYMQRITYGDYDFLQFEIYFNPAPAGTWVITPIMEEEGPHVHDYETVVTAPTCTEEGYTTYTCDCGESYESDFVDATGHSYEDGVCSVCGDVKTIIPEGAPFINMVTSDGKPVVITEMGMEPIYGMGTLYKVEVPLGTTQVNVTYPEGVVMDNGFGYSMNMMVGFGNVSDDGYVMVKNNGEVTVGLAMEKAPANGSPGTIKLLNIPYGDEPRSVGFYDSSYNPTHFFAFTYKLEEGQHFAALPEGVGYTATGEPVASDGYTFNVTILDGYEATADFAIKVNGETVATKPGDITIDSVTEDLNITVEGVLKIVDPENDIYVTVDLTDYSGHISGSIYAQDKNYESQEIELVAGTRNSLAVDASTNYCFQTSIYEVNSLVLGYEVNGIAYPIPASYSGYDIASGIRMNMNAGGYLQISTYEGVGPYTITIKPIVGTPESVGAAPDFVEDSIDITDIKVLGADVVSAEWDGDTLNIVLAEGTAENAMIKTLWTIAVDNNNGGGQALFNINGKLQTPGAHATFDWAYGLTLENGTATGKVVFAQANVYWDPDSQLNFTDKIFTVNFSIEGAEPDVLLGDVNGDGSIDISDVQLLFEYVLGITSISDDQIMAGNVNDDSVTDISDVQRLFEYVLGIITEL